MMRQLYKGLIVKRVILFLIFTVLDGCNNKKPQAITLGSDNCSFCKMSIADQRFAGEIKTSKGKIYTFDSVECLVAFCQNQHVSQIKNNKVWIHDFFHPKVWLSAGSAYYLQSDKIHTPMGLGLIALKNEKERKEAISVLGGTGMDWARIFIYVKKHLKS